MQLKRGLPTLFRFLARFPYNFISLLEQDFRVFYSFLLHIEHAGKMALSGGTLLWSHVGILTTEAVDHVRVNWNDFLARNLLCHKPDLIMFDIGFVCMDIFLYSSRNFASQHVVTDISWECIKFKLLLRIFSKKSSGDKKAIKNPVVCQVHKEVPNTFYSPIDGRYELDKVWNHHVTDNHPSNKFNWMIADP